MTAVVVVLAGIWLFFHPPVATPIKPVVTDVSDLIQVTSPQPNEVFYSGATVTGKARGTWYFEASFPVRLEDANGAVMAQTPAQAQGDWMTSEFVPFKATLTFAKVTTPTGVLILKNDNPSGDPLKDKELRIPVKFADGLKADFGKAFTLRVGQTVSFPDALTVGLKSIDDSRCKPEVQCIWSGQLAPVLTLAGEEVWLGTVNNKTVTARGYTFALQGATENSATITVTKGSAAGTGMTGDVHVGPTCPVEKSPPDPNCADRPLADATITVFKKGSTTALATTKTDAAGHFILKVPAGIYRVTAGVGSSLPRCPETEVGVAAGQFTKVPIACDSGIR